MHDVIVIGAGLSGICAALRLQQAGKDVRVVEARERVGGRTRAGTISGMAIDLGGQWVGPGQTRVLTLIEELNLRQFPQFDHGRHVLDLGGTVSSYRGLIPRLALRELAATAITLHKLNRLARRIPPSFKIAQSKLESLDSLSAEQGICALTSNPVARELLRMTMRAIWCAEPAEISWLWVLAYIGAAKSIEALASVKGGAQQTRIAGGAWQIAERLADRLLPGTIELGSPVSAVDKEDASLIVHHPRGHSRAKAVILATAPSLMRTIECSHPGFSRRLQLAERMPMGRTVKAVLAYDRPFWRDLGYSGQAVSDGSGFGPVFDACQPGHNTGLLVGFFEAEATDVLRCEDTRRQAAQAAVQRWFGAGALPLRDYAEHDWNSDPWSGGCYAGLPQVGALSKLSDALRTPCDGLYWAGTETATQWIGYMDGAIEAGYRAAQEVLDSTA